MKCSLLYSLLNKRPGGKTLCKFTKMQHFWKNFVKLTEKTVLQYFCSLGSAKVLQALGSKSIAGIFSSNWRKNSSAILLLPRECKTFSSFFPSISRIFPGKSKNSVKLMWNCGTAKQFLFIWPISYLVKLYSNSIAWSPIGRHMIFANPWEPISSLGASPLGMKWLPRVCKNHSLPLGDHAIIYFTIFW